MSIPSVSSSSSSSAQPLQQPPAATAAAEGALKEAAAKAHGLVAERRSIEFYADFDQLCLASSVKSLPNQVLQLIIPIPITQMTIEALQHCMPMLKKAHDAARNLVQPPVAAPEISIEERDRLAMKEKLWFDPSNSLSKTNSLFYKLFYKFTGVRSLVVAKKKQHLVPDESIAFLAHQFKPYFMALLDHSNFKEGYRLSMLPMQESVAWLKQAGFISDGFERIEALFGPRQLFQAAHSKFQNILKAQQPAQASTTASASAAAAAAATTSSTTTSSSKGASTSSMPNTTASASAAAAATTTSSLEETRLKLLFAQRKPFVTEFLRSTHFESAALILTLRLVNASREEIWLNFPFANVRNRNRNDLEFVDAFYPIPAAAIKVVKMLRLPKFIPT